MKSLPRRTQFFALCSLLCACAPAALGQASPPRIEPPPLAWHEFTSADGAFTAKFPAPKPSVRQVPFQRGPLNLMRHAHEASVPGHYTFQIVHVDYPAGHIDPELSAEGGILGLVRSLTKEGGRVLTNAPVRRGTCEGREATLVLPNASTGGEAFAHGRIFYSGRRYYILVFVSEADGEAARRVGQTFLDSFTIKGGCPKPVAPTPAPTTAPTTAPVRRSVAGTPDPSTGWRKIESAEHGFSVLMPGGAELESEQTQTEPIPLSHHTYSHDGANAIFTAEVTGDYPPGFNNAPGALQYLLDITFLSLKRNLEPTGFTLTPGRDLKSGEFPGREYRVANAELKAEGRAQLYATPKRLYVFITIGRESTPAAAADLERFFSSVRLSDK